MRRTRKHRRGKQKKFLIIGSLSLLLFLCVGYAAFSTNLSLKAKGNIKLKTLDDYIQDNLFYFIDGINNTKNGHDTNAMNWENLIDNGYTSTIMGFEETTWTQDNGLLFDGVDDYIDTGFLQGAMGNEITFEFVSTPSSTNDYRGYFGYHTANYLENGIYNGVSFQFGENELQFSYYGDDTFCGLIDLTQEEVSKYLLNKKSDITIVMSTKNYIAIYINGEEIHRNTCTNNFVPDKINHFFIAKSFPDDDRYFQGTMYNFMIYRKALTEDEIKHNYGINKIRYDL